MAISLEGNLAGYVGAAIAALFFGSNYIIFKKYEIGDGIFVQFAMSIGILLVGYAATLFGEFRFEHTGLIGGALWAVGNALVPLVIKLNGLGLSLLLWSSGNLLVGYSIGKFGLFGLDKEEVSNEILNIVGAAMGLLSLLGYFFIQPENGENETQTLNNSTINSNANNNNNGERNGRYSALSSSLDYPYTSFTNNSNDDANNRLSDSWPFKRSSLNDNGNDDNRNYASSSVFVDPASDHNDFGIVYEGIWDKFIENYLDTPKKKRYFGLALSSSIGVLYGTTMTFFQLWWTKDRPDEKQPAELDYAFSHFSGVFLSSFAILVIYTIATGNRPQIYPRSFMPGVVCGMMWAIAMCGWFVVNSNLGMSVGFPIVVISPGIISSLFSVFLFHEISTRRNLTILCISLSLNIGCVMCVAFSIG